MNNKNFVNNTIILLLFFTCHSSIAQITIVEDDLMVVGTEIDIYYDTTGPLLDMGSTGTGQNWDFTGLTVSGQYNSDILSPAGATGAAYFPTATAALHRLEINTQFYENTPTELIHLGTVVTVLDTFVFYENYTVLKYPTSLGSSLTDAGDKRRSYSLPLAFDPDGPGGPHPFVDSVVVMTQTLYDNEVDAEGTLKSPDGEYEALRNYSINIEVDSAFMYVSGSPQPISTTLSTLFMIPAANADTSYVYTWMAKGMSLPVVTVEYDPATNKVIVAQWIKQKSPGTTGMENITPSAVVNVFPNPAKNAIHINCEMNNGHASLFDIQGKLLISIVLNESQNILPVEELKPGTYVLKICDENEQVLSSKKVLISE